MPARRRQRERDRRRAALEVLAEIAGPGEPIRWPPDGEDGQQWRITQHARRRAISRGISLLNVLEAAAYPTVRYPSFGLSVLRRGRVSVVVDPQSHTVVTVLLAGTDRWDDATAREAFAALPLPDVPLRGVGAPPRALMSAAVDSVSARGSVSDARHLDRDEMSKGGHR